MQTKIRSYLVRTAQQMKDTLNERLLPYDITPQQARVIGFVCSEQREGKTICQKDIEDAFQLKGSSITSLLQGLQRKNFIVRHTDSSDERRKIVTVLPKGEALTSEFETVFRDLEEKMVRGLSIEQQRMLLQFLEHVAENLEG